MNAGAPANDASQALSRLRKVIRRNAGRHESPKEENGLATDRRCAGAAGGGTSLLMQGVLATRFGQGQPSWFSAARTAATMPPMRSALLSLASVALLAGCGERVPAEPAP